MRNSKRPSPSAFSHSVLARSMPSAQSTRTTAASSAAALKSESSSTKRSNGHEPSSASNGSGVQTGTGGRYSGRERRPGSLRHCNNRRPASQRPSAGEASEMSAVDPVASRPTTALSSASTARRTRALSSALARATGCSNFLYYVKSGPAGDAVRSRKFALIPKTPLLEPAFPRCCASAAVRRGPPRDAVLGGSANRPTGDRDPRRGRHRPGPDPDRPGSNLPSHGTPKTPSARTAPRRCRWTKTRR